MFIHGVCCKHYAELESVFSLKCESEEVCHSEDCCIKIINDYGASLVMMASVNKLQKRLACKLS